MNSNYQPKRSSSRNLSQQGGGFILRIQLGAQLLSSLFGPWLGVYFIYVTTNPSRQQLIQLLASTAIGLLLVNIGIMAYAIYCTRQARAYLNHLFKNKPLPEGSGRLAAWSETMIFPRRSAIAQIALNYAFIVIPVMLFMRLSGQMSGYQSIYLVMGGSISALVVLVIGFLYIDTGLAPAREVLLPDESSLQNIQITISQHARQYIITTIILLIVIFTIGGIAYEKMQALFAMGADPLAILASFRTHLIIMGIVLLGLGIILASRLARATANPTQEIIRIMEQVQQGDYSERAEILTSDDMGRLTIRFNQMIGQLQTTQTTLEKQVQERTSSLEQRSMQLQAAARVAREAASLRDLNAILSMTVNLISEQIGFYHAGIFLLDDAGEYAVLQAASSDGGKNMLARGHRLIVGQQGIVGAAAYHNKPRIALDVGADREFFNNPDLPLTRSEAALPLTVHDKVIGVLDIQSIEESKFTQDDIEVLQILADQVALAIQNARLFNESQDAIQRLEATTAEGLRRTWQDRVHNIRNAYRYSAGGLTPLHREDDENPAANETENYLSIPINLRGQRIGTISLHRKGDTTWSESDRFLVNEVSAQVGLALENARLVQDTQLRAEREQTLSQMTARIRESLDIDIILQTAVREIKQSFNLDKAEVRLQLADQPKPDGQPRQ